MLRALRFEGRYLVVGFASGDIPDVPFNQILLNDRTVIGIDGASGPSGCPTRTRRRTTTSSTGASRAEWSSRRRSDQATRLRRSCLSTLP
jgi:hypothetical protein